MAFALPVLFAAAAASARAQAHDAACPHHAGHAGSAPDHAASAPRHAGVAERGDAEMGFDHRKTTHHFRLTASGGVIEVTANDAGDTASRDAIRAHLTALAASLANGDFETPRRIHDRVPPGAPVLRRKSSAIVYAYRELPAGAEVALETADREALAAVHEFLRFQIEEHETGDSTSVE
jgi:hypothetical protein